MFSLLYSEIITSCFSIITNNCQKVSCSCIDIYHNEAHYQVVIYNKLFLKIDTIDLSSENNPPFHYIIHFRDYFTRFLWAIALENKTTKSVAIFLYNTFHVFSLLLVLHSNNSQEFEIFW